ncbi:MAG: substrate-binding domain-containing protein [Clostridiales bacterium]|nr:substrate-binding domain-containing protein [Clostridiales bacterium]
MKKKLLSILLAFGLIISCAGCKAKDSGSDKTGSEKISNISITKEEKEDTDPSESAKDPSVTDPSEKEDQKFEFTKSIFPRIRYSYTSYPFGSALVTVLLGMDRGEAYPFLNAIMWEDSARDEIVLANDYDASYWIIDSSLEYEKEVIAKDALVFIVNKDNPVDSLTADQVKKIYKGEIKNWKEVGGRDEKIRAFENGVVAVSQKMLEGMVVGGETSVESPYFMTGTDDYGVFKARKTYDNEISSIGFLQYSCLKDATISDQIKILKIDGVDAQEETISKGEYPYSFNEYVMIPEGTKEGSPAERLYSWILSEEGKKLLLKEGYILPSDGSFTKDASDIKTKWEAYEETKTSEDVFTRSSEGPVKEFKASGEYGKIYPFLGVQNESKAYEGEKIYGFIDESGKIICDPVFNGVSRLSDGSYIVVQDVTDTKSKDIDHRVGVISDDGSIYTGLLYEAIYEVDGQIFFYNIEKNGIKVFSYDPESGKASSGKNLLMDTSTLYAFQTVVDERYVVTCDYLGGGCHVFDGTTGKDVLPKMGEDGYIEVYNGLLAVTDSDTDYLMRVYTIDGKLLSEKEYYSAVNELQNGNILLVEGRKYDSWDLFGKDGKIKKSIEDPHRSILNMEVSGEYILALKQSSVDLYDLDLNLLKTVEIEKDSSCCFLTPPYDGFSGENMTLLPSDPIIFSASASGRTKELINLKTETRLTVRAAFECQIMGSRILLRDVGDRANADAEWKILDASDLHVIAEGKGYSEAIEDKAKHEYYLITSITDSSADVKVLQVEDGKVIFENLPNPKKKIISVKSIEDGKIIFHTERPGIIWNICTGVTMMDTEGKVLFHYTPFVLPK